MAQDVVWTDGQRAYMLMDLLAQHCSTVDLVSMASCSQPLREASREHLREERARTLAEIRMNLSACVLGHACCRASATTLSINGQPITVELPAVMRFAGMSGLRVLRLRNICLSTQGMRLSLIHI